MGSRLYYHSHAYYGLKAVSYFPYIMDLGLLCSITFNYTHLKFIKAEM